MASMAHTFTHADKQIVKSKPQRHDAPHSNCVVQQTMHTGYLHQVSIALCRFATASLFLLSNVFSLQLQVLQAELFSHAVEQSCTRGLKADITVRDHTVTSAAQQSGMTNHHCSCLQGNCTLTTCRGGHLHKDSESRSASKAVTVV